MRNLLTSASDYLNNTTRAFIANLVKIEFKTSSGSSYLYLTDYSRNILYNGSVYATGKIKRIGSIKQSIDLSVNSLSITISGAISEEVDRFISSGAKILGSKVEILQAHLDQDTGSIIPFTQDNAPIMFFKGKISGGDISDSISKEEIGSSTITWNLSNDFFDFDKVNGRITSDASHRALEAVNGVMTPSGAAKRPEYQDDKGFLYADKSISILAQYQTKELRYKMKTKRKGGLGGLVGMKNYKLVEYYADVTKEVDLSFDLTAKYLPVVYGVRKVGGIPVFADTERDNPNSVWIVYAVCEGEIEGFLDIYMDDKPLICIDDADDEARVCFGRKRVIGNTMNSYATGGSGDSSPSTHGQNYEYTDDDGSVSFWTFHGKANQTVCTVLQDLAANNKFKIQEVLQMGSEYWDSSFKLLDTAYVVVNIHLSEDRDTVPSFEFEVEGRKVNVYKANSEYVNSSHTSLNPAWQILDYITSNRFGPGLQLSDVVLSSFVDIAALYDTIDTSYQSGWVPFWRYLGWKSQDNSYRTIMQFNTKIDTAESIFKNLDSLLGQSLSSLPIFDGKYYLTAERNAPPVFDISGDDIIDGSIKVTDTTGRDRYNTVAASIDDPGQMWNSTSVTFFNSNYLTEDNKVEKKLNLQFDYITNYYTARSLSERELKKSRYSREIDLTLPFKYLGILPNDFITLTYPRYGWNAKLFKVTDTEQDYSGKLNLTLKEFSLDAFITSGQADIGDTQTPSTEALLPPRNLVYTPEPKSQDTSKNGTLSWKASLSPGVAYYNIKQSNSLETVSVLVDGPYNADTEYSYDFYNLSAGMYTFEVRAVTITGSRSKAITLTVNVDPSKNLKPVTNFAVTNLASGSSTEFVGGYLQMTWDKTSDEDIINGLRYLIEIYNDSNVLIRSVYVNAGTYSYNYTYSNMKADYKAVTGLVGIYRYYRLRIKVVGLKGEESVSWAELS